MSTDFIMCARNLTHGRTRFGSEPGETKYLEIPENELPSPSQSIKASVWATQVMAEARAMCADDEFGHLLVFIHGYNNDQPTVMKRHRRLKQDLAARNFRGTVVSFDWPTANLAINYLEDRLDAKHTALQLVTDGLSLFVRRKRPGCNISVHILAHSMGALVVREAFDDADDRRHLAAENWLVSQVMFIGGDISSGSLSAGNSSSDSLYRHCVRLTNYTNRHDGVLALSNAKRLGVARRVGRAGLPDDAPVDKSVELDCSDYCQRIPAGQQIIGDRGHSWHIGDPGFTDDILMTMLGIDRQSMFTREGSGSRLRLVKPPG
ncbi:MAG: alpha/beta hydrolase [Blastocatellia bacterium]